MAPDPIGGEDVRERTIANIAAGHLKPVLIDVRMLDDGSQHRFDEPFGVVVEEVQRMFVTTG